MFNHSQSSFVIKKGDRIAQLICEKILYPDLQEAEVRFNLSTFGLKLSNTFDSSTRPLMRQREDLEDLGPLEKTKLDKSIVRTVKYMLSSIKPQYFVRLGLDNFLSSLPMLSSRPGSFCDRLASRSRAPEPISLAERDCLERSDLNPSRGNRERETIMTRPSRSTPVSHVYQSLSLVFF